MLLVRLDTPFALFYGEILRDICQELLCRHASKTGPIFLTYRKTDSISELVDSWAQAHEAEYDFTAEDGVRHIVWVIDDTGIAAKLEEAFGGIPDFYIADGHHRTASAVRVGCKRREDNPGYTGEEDFNFFLAVLFPDEELSIWDYNRLVNDLRGMTAEQFLTDVAKDFTIEKCEGRVKPDKKHSEDGIGFARSPAPSMREILWAGLTYRFFSRICSPPCLASAIRERMTAFSLSAVSEGLESWRSWLMAVRQSRFRCILQRRGI